ncbi:phage tail tape measure protein [Sediminispirochaeta bajacaliforniensis]|uniref:phage tail tape measure protein n=1 Tax=Sediminispirochaeta bajacaliforniensis TaxID=148 RepID=UPI000360A633|nr:phage tail tape measure protein [Sediminispirochaeta bajacaliforniensis]
MSDFVTSVTLLFRDQFTSGFSQAAGRIEELRGEIHGYADEIKSGGMLDVAADMSMVSMEVGELARNFQQLTAVPGQVAAEFEVSMARVSTVLNDTNAIGGDTAGSMERIAEAAAEMAGGISEAGSIASVGAREFADSVYTMLSSGLTVEQGIAATEQAALLAQATGGSLQEAASALTGIFNNMGDKSAEAGTEMQRLSDIVAGTQNYFAFENLGQFTQGFANVSGLAVSAQAPLEQVAAALGQLNTNMITGAEAGTAMKSALAQMSTASERLGFDVARTSEGGIDLMQTLRNISAAGYSSDDLIGGFGTEAGPAVSLLTANLGDLEAGFDAVSNSAGVTLDNAGKMADTLTRRQEGLNNSWAVFQERIGGGANAVKGLGVEAATAGVRFLNWATSLPLVGENLAGIAGATLEVGGAMAGGFSTVLQMSTGLLSFTMLMDRFGSIAGMMRSSMALVGVQVKALGTGILNAGRAVIGFIPSAISWMGTMWGVAAAHMAAYWPIYAVVAGVAAVAAGAVWVVRNWDTVTEFFVNLWEGIKNVFATVWDWIKNLFLTYHPIGIIVQNWEPITQFFSGLWEGVTNVFSGAWDFIKGIWSDYTIIGQIIQNWDSIREFFAGLWDSIVSLATGAVDRILAPFRAVKERVQELLPDFLTSGEGIFQTVGSGVAEGGRRLVDGVRGAFARVGDLLPHSDAKEGPFSTLTAAGRAIPETMADGMRAGNGLPDAARSQFAQVNNVLQFPSGERLDVQAVDRQQDSGISGVLRDLVNRIGSGGTDGGKNERPIQVENLYVQFSEAADLTRFVEELREQVEDVS